MASRTPGVLLDGSEGSMIELAKSSSLQHFIDRHNDPDDPYHLNDMDRSISFFSFCKDTFGEDIPVQQSWGSNHVGGTKHYPIKNQIFRNCSKYVELVPN